MDAKKLAALLQNLDAQSFRPGDSLIASSINHPVDAVSHGLDWLTKNVNTAAGIPEQYDNPTPWLAPSPDQQTQAAGNIAGLAQLGAFPFAPKSAGGTLGTVANIADDLPETEYSRAHKIAQQNAVDMLGLPPDNTSMDRAKAMGFDTPVYHGTNADIRQFDYKYTGNGNDQYGSGFYMDTRPHVASGYAEGDGASVYPLMVNVKNPLDSSLNKTLTKKQITDIIKKSPELDDALSNYGDIDYEGKAKVLREAINTNFEYQGENLLNNLHPLNNDFYRDSPDKFNDIVNKTTGFDGVKVNFEDGQHVIPWRPNQIRSRFAAFDPAKRDSSDLLASWLLPATMLGYGLLGDKEQNKNALIEALRNGY